jgi:hypothetical protein
MARRRRLPAMRRFNHGLRKSGQLTLIMFKPNGGECRCPCNDETASAHQLYLKRNRVYSTVTWTPGLLASDLALGLCPAQHE